MKRFSKILCVALPGEDRKAVIARAVVLAQANQATITVFDVVESSYAGVLVSKDATYQKLSLQLRKDRLKELVSEYASQVELDIKVEIGIPYLEVIRKVLRGGYDLVVKHAKEIDWMDKMIVSEDMHLLRKCPCPVWLIDSDTPVHFKSVIAAIDLDDECSAEELVKRKALNRHILELACSNSLSESTELNIISVWQPFKQVSGFISRSGEMIESYNAELLEKQTKNLQVAMEEVAEYLGADAFRYVQPKTHLLEGDPRSIILSYAKRLKAELVVMGSVVRTGIPGFIVGITAETVLGQLDCSVLVVKPQGFVTPVTLDH